MIEPITEADHAELVERDPYFRGRWPYTEAALRLSDLVPRASVLEVGPWGAPLFIGGDSLDVRPHPLGVPPTYQHDATVTPWPIETGRYDLLIGLQVWEHLRGHQREAWREARRVARAVLLSFPIYWPDDADETHRGITFDEIAGWTEHEPPYRTEIVGWQTTRPRMVALWRGR